MKLLFDLFPVILFFIAFKSKGIFFATAVAIVASVVQIGYIYFKHKKVEPMQWISLLIIVVFGGATLLLHNETFIKWKPTVLYWTFSIALLASQFIWKKNLIQMLLTDKVDLTSKGWSGLSLSWGIFFAVLGIANVIVAYTVSTDMWVNFKMFGATGALFVFAIGQAMFIGKYVKSEKESTPVKQGE